MGWLFRISTKSSIVVLVVLTLLTIGIAQAPAGKPATETPQAPTVTADELKEAVIIESSHTKVTYQDDGSDVREVTSVIKILSQAGVQGMAVLKFSYTSADENVEFDYVRVRKADGTVVVTPDYNIQDMPADVSRSAPMYSDVHEKHVTVKALGVGDTLEYVVRYRTTKPQVPGQFWFAYNFAKDVVTKDEQLVIDVPSDKTIKISSPDLKPQTVDQGNRRVYTWKRSNLQRQDESKKVSPLQQATTPRPSVLITTFRSWEEVGHWYGELARSQVVVTPQIQAKAAELTKGMTSDEDKIRALYEFVSTHYHYVSLSFGIGRYQPHPAEDVFENEYGDCKDKHTLLATLLKAAGYDAWPALMNATNMDVNPEVPSPGQFDHVITVVPRNGDLLWLDTTPGVAPFGMLMANLRHKLALVIPINKPALLITTPENPPFQNEQTFTAKGRLSSGGSLTAHMQITAFGDVGTIERYVLQQYPPAQWKDVVQRISYGGGFGGDVSMVDVSGLSDINKPLAVSYDYKRDDYSDWKSGRIGAPLPPMGIEAASEKEPDTSVKLGAPGSIAYKAQIELPSGYTPTLPAKVDLSEDFADFHSAYEVKDGVLTVTRTLTVKQPEVASTGWARYQKFAKAVENDHDAWIVLSNGKDDNTAEATLNPEAARIFQEGDEALQQRDLTRARESFQRVIEIDPKFPGAHANLGMTYLSENATDAGIRELKKEEELHPDEAFSYQTLARVYAFKHDNAAAIDELHNLLKIDSKNRDAALNLGRLLSSEKRYGEALLVLQKAAEEAPDSGAIKYELGYTYIHNGDKEKGLAVLQEALKNDQEHDRDTMALNNVAYSLIEMDTGMDVAKQYADKALQIQQAESLKAGSGHNGLMTTANLGATWDTVGWIYFKQGDYDKALPYLRSSWLLMQDIEVGDHLGQLYAKQGKKQEAAHVYRLAYAAMSPQKSFSSGTSTIHKVTEHYEDLMGKGSNPGNITTTRKADGTYTETPTEQLSRMRMVKVSTAPHSVRRGTFSIVFVPGKVEEVTQVDGDESLMAEADDIRSAKFKLEFPDSSPTKLVRRGVLSCGGSGCDLVLIPVDDRSLLSVE